MIQPHLVCNRLPAGIKHIPLSRCAMAKDKQPKTKGITNKHLHARTTFLYQAATYLTLQDNSTPKRQVLDAASDHVSNAEQCSSGHRYSGLALQLGSDLQTVSRKGQIRLSVDLKRSICKGCNTILVPGRTATHRIENASKGGRKPHADVLVVECVLCGGKKRFPVGAKHQRKKTHRELEASEGAKTRDADDTDQIQPSTREVTTDQSPTSG